MSPRRTSPSRRGIRFGLVALKGVGRNVINGLLEERSKGGPFTDFMDFCDRMFDRDLNRRVLESLIKSGSFDRMGRLPPADGGLWTGAGRHRCQPEAEPGGAAGSVRNGRGGGAGRPCPPSICRTSRNTVRRSG